MQIVKRSVTGDVRHIQIRNCARTHAYYAVTPAIVFHLELQATIETHAALATKNTTHSKKTEVLLKLKINL